MAGSMLSGYALVIFLNAPADGSQVAKLVNHLRTTVVRCWACRLAGFRQHCGQVCAENLI